jgi:xylan 1,4-beta-xylosidase
LTPHALASLDGKELSVMLWHYHDDDLPGPDADVELSLAGLPLASGDARVRFALPRQGASLVQLDW